MELIKYGSLATILICHKKLSFFMLHHEDDVRATTELQVSSTASPDQAA